MNENDEINKLYICRAARCKKNNSDNIVEMLEKVLKTKIDDDSGESLIKLETTHCLGQCNFGPNIRANGKIYTKVDKEILKRVLSIMKARIIGSKNE